MVCVCNVETVECSNDKYKPGKIANQLKLQAKLGKPNDADLYIFCTFHNPPSLNGKFWFYLILVKHKTHSPVLGLPFLAFISFNNFFGLGRWWPQSVP